LQPVQQHTFSSNEPTLLVQETQRWAQQQPILKPAAAAAKAAAAH
jgi:hypothetical protein